MLNQHGLIQEAKPELIMWSSVSQPILTRHSYYLLGSIAFDENKVSVA